MKRHVDIQWETPSSPYYLPPWKAPQHQLNHCLKFDLCGLTGHSFIETPTILKSKHAVINVENRYDSNCSIYSILVVLRYNDVLLTRIEKHDIGETWFLVQDSTWIVMWQQSTAVKYHLKLKRTNGGCGRRRRWCDLKCDNRRERGHFNRWQCDGELNFNNVSK